MLFIFKITEGHVRSLFLKLKKSLLLTSVYYVLCRNSYVGNLSLFYEIEEKLKQLPGWYIAWLLLKMEHYFIGFPQILILDANRSIPLSLLILTSLE
uniref:Uncharacterized protein n=1 Tax=Gossypium raimondii TaxID=29730 RepID=A0A0D2U1G7_GOSRA|nr:hypothetical protein B456_008G116000 [Gossypium raimondii]